MRDSWPRPRYHKVILGIHAIRCKLGDCCYCDELKPYEVTFFYVFSGETNKQKDILATIDKIITLRKRRKIVQTGGTLVCHRVRTVHSYHKNVDSRLSRSQSFCRGRAAGAHQHAMSPTKTDDTIHFLGGACSDSVCTAIDAPSP